MKTETQTTDKEQPIASTPRKTKSRCCCITTITILLILLTIFLIILILALTVFKPKDPKATVKSVTVQGVSPRVTFPTIKIDLNITLDLDISVYNPNPASFKHGTGKSFLFYREKQVGEVDLFPGNIPSKGSEVLKCRLVLDADEIASEMSALVSDVLGGQMVLETRTRIPGRVNFLGLFKKHAVAFSYCQVTVKISDFSILKQVCRNKTKL